MESSLVKDSQPAAKNNARFLVVLTACALFIVLILGVLAYGVSRPQTATLKTNEGQAVAQCWRRNGDSTQTALFRKLQTDACQEMEEQFHKKFQNAALLRTARP
ncbi:hypothetical protein [Paraburkholderia hospita]|nr:hypothetical protein [Paraburkholderia hospita]